MEPELVLGEIRGYRGWRLGHNYELIPLNNLLPVNGTIRPGEESYQWLQAECRRQALRCKCIACEYVEQQMLMVNEKHHPPVEPCTCGFYAVYGGDGLNELLNKQIPYYADLIIGSVLMAGRIIKGETGVMRAEKMRLEALVNIPRYFRTPPNSRSSGMDRMHLEQDVAHAHSVPYMDLPRFLTKYPLENSSSELNYQTLCHWGLLPDDDVDATITAFYPPINLANRIEMSDKWRWYSTYVEPQG